MEEIYQIAYAEEPAWDVIGPAISQYNKQQGGDDHAKSLCFVLRAPDQEIVGGIIGATYWDWFQLDLLWIREDLRGRGYGHRLLVAAEEEARRRGAKHVHLDTFTFQAPDFYQRHGYEVFGALPDYPAGHTRYYMRKDL